MTFSLLVAKLSTTVLAPNSVGANNGNKLSTVFAAAPTTDKPVAVLPLMPA